MRATSDEAGTSDVDSLLRLVRAHQQQHDESEYDASSSAAICRCKTMLTKLRKLLPKLMRPVATLSTENAVPVLRNLCQLLTLLLDGSVCPHSMTIFMENNTQGANVASSGFPSYPTMATMMFYMVSFYTNERFRAAQHDVRNVTLRMVSFLQRNDVYGFLHFVHDTVLLLEDCFCMEETLKRRDRTGGIPSGTTIACYLNTAIHVYQDADGPLGAKSNVTLCGCMPITDTTQLAERREQLKQMLPSILVSSYGMLVVLRQSMIDLMEQIIRQHSATLEKTHDFDRLCRLVELLIVRNEALVTNSSSEYPNDAVSTQNTDEVTRSTLRLLYTMLQVSERTKRTFVRLVLVYLKSSVHSSTNSRIVKAWTAIVKLIGETYSRLSSFCLDTLWLPFKRWVASNLQFLQTAPHENRAYKETICMAVLKILGVYIQRSNTLPAAILLVKLLETLDVRVSSPALISSVICGIHRVLSTKEILIKVVCFVSKELLCNDPNRPQDQDTGRKRQRSEMASSKERDCTQESSSTALYEKLGRWILNLVTVKSTDRNVVEATSISLRVILPLRRYIVAFAPLESFSLFQALFQRVELILNTYAPSLTPLTSDYLDLWIILLRYYDNHELVKYRDLFNKVLEGIESQQLFTQSAEQAKDFTVPDCWDYMAFLELYRRHSTCHDMSPSEKLDQVSYEFLHSADAVLDGIFQTSTILRGPFLMYFVWSRRIVLDIIDDDSWRNARPWKFIHRHLLQESSLDVTVCSYLAMTPLIAFFGVAESLTTSKKLLTCIMEIFCDKMQRTKSERVFVAVTKACGAVLCATAYGQAFAGGTKYLEDEKLDVEFRAKSCQCRLRISHVQVSPIPLAFFEQILCTESHSVAESLHVARIHALSSVFEHCQVDVENDQMAIRFVNNLLSVFASPSGLALQAVLNSIAHRPRLFDAMVKPTQEGASGLMERLETLITVAGESSDDKTIISIMRTSGTIGCECDPKHSDHGELYVSILLKLVFLWNRFCIGHRSRCTAIAYDQIYRITSHHRVSWRELCFDFPTLLYFPLVDELLGTKTLKLFLGTFLGGNIDTKVFLRASAPYVLPKYVVHQNERMLHTFTDELNGVKQDMSMVHTSQEGDAFITITDLLNNHIGYVLKDLIMHQVQALTNTNRLAEIEFLFKFLPENSTVRDVILHSPFQLMNLLAWELGGPHYRVAKRAIREVAKYLHEDSREAEIEQHGSLQPGVGCMPRRYLLALLTDLGNRISGTKSTAFKIRAIKSMDRLLEVFSGVSGESKNSIQSPGLVDPFVPKVMATLKVGLTESNLQEHAITAWGNFLRMLSSKALEANLSSIVVSLLPCLGHDASSILTEDSSISGSQCWNLETLAHVRHEDDGGQVQSSSDEDGKCRVKCMVPALEILRYLFIEKQTELQAAFPTIPLLPSIPELDEIYVALYQNDGDPRCRPLSEYLMNLSVYVNHVDVAVREVALAQLLRCLVTRGTEIEKLMQNEGNLFIPDAIASVVQSVLHLSRTESQESIKLFCARCLGALGAIDAARMPLNMVSATSGPHGGAVLAKEKSCQKVEHSTKDLACVLIETWLVKELRAAPENTDALAFAIQELLKFLAELTADPQHSGQNLAATKYSSALVSHTRQTARAPMPEWMKRRFERKNVLQFVEPYWSTNYSISGGRASRHKATSSLERQSLASTDPSLFLTRNDISLYEKYGTSYEEWLLMWCRRLIHLSQPPERKIFWACKTALPKSPQIARFLLPYLIQNVLRSGKSEVGEELKKEVMAVLNGQDCGISMDHFLMAPPESKHVMDGKTAISMSDTFYRHDQCCQTIFSTVDELNDWIWTSEKKRLALCSSAASRHTSASSSRSDVPSDVEDHEKDYLEEFLKEIPIRTLSSAAYKIKAYARALQYFEIYLRQEEFLPTNSMDTSVESTGPVHLSLIAKNAFYLQQLYKSIDEPDALVGLASLRRFYEAYRHDSATGNDMHEEKSKLTDLMHEIVDSEQLAQWENALACYELAIQEVQRALVSKSLPSNRAQGNQVAGMQPPIQLLDADALNDPDLIKPKLYSGMVGCFIQLGRLESALQQINGIVTVEPQFMTTMYPLALECSWRMSRWELLTELLSAEKQNPLLHYLASEVDGAKTTRLNGFDVSQLMRVRVLHSLHGGEQEEFQRHLKAARLEVIGPLAAASAESYQRAYPLLHDLHFLHEAEQGFIFLEKARQTADLGHRSALWTQQTPWTMRYDAMAMQLKYRDPILALRRVILHEAALRNEVSENWLSYAKLTRKEGFIRTAKSAVMHAEALDNRHALIEKAKLLVRQDRMYEALRILEPVDIDASTLDFEVEDPHFCAKHLLLATNYMQQTGQRQGRKVIERYQAVIHYSPRWEKGYFYLAKYYEYLLSVTHPDALNGSMGSDEVASLLVDSVFHDQVIHLMKNYVLALAHGTKFLFQSLPRLLTLWFDFGEVLYTNSYEQLSTKAHKKQRQVEIGPSQSVTEQRVLNDITAIVAEAIKCLPAYQWLVCFPQVTSRICHPNPVVVEGVKEIMLRVLAAYPTQAMWPLLGLSLSLNPQRRSCARDVIVATQREFVSKGLKEIADSFSEGMRMAEELISLAAHDPGKGQRKIRIRLSRIRTQILLPIQEALRTILPASGLAPRDEFHTAFSPAAQIYIKAFSDKADVMMTKEKPKRIEILGTDGQLYPFLCKREKYGDLRKDARMMEFNSMINKLLQKDREGRKRKLRLRTYAVVCLNEESGLMEWVKHTKAMRQLVGQIHKTERGYIQPVRLTNETKDLFLNMQKKFANDRQAMASYYRREVLALPVFTPRFHQWFLNNFADPTAWFEARLAFSRSAAVWSMVGHIIGLGDRHGENILIDCTNGECVHVDFDCLFDKGLKLAIPEIVPFRLTPNMVDACGITGYEGVFRRVCEVTMHLLRNNKETLRSVLESFIHDPLVEWGRRGKTTQSHDDASKVIELSSERSKMETRLVLKAIDDRLQGMYNLGAAIRPFVSSAHRRILPEIETLPLSVEGQVEKLIHEATSHENLAQMYIGWMPFL